MSEISKTTVQALRLLTSLTHAPASTAELAREHSIARTIVARLVASLREEGYVQRRSDGRWIVGFRVLELVKGARNSLVEAAMPILSELSRTTSETAVLTLLDGDEGISAAQAVGDQHLLRTEYPSGFRHALTVGAAGRAILAFANPQTRERVLKNADDGVRENLEGVRAVGFAYSLDELKAGAAAVAAPVLDAEGFAAGAVGIVLPLDRWTGPDEIAPLVTSAAAQVNAFFRDEEAAAV